jgi:hypothetical protein
MRSFHVVEFAKKTETAARRKLNATGEFMRGCHL